MSRDQAAVYLITADISDALLEDPRQRDLYDIWRAARRKWRKLVSAHANIDITELRGCIGNLLMLQVEDDGQDLQYLVHGTQVACDYGKI